MDTITHALVGAAISDACFRQRLGRRATPFALIAGALPDIDLAVRFVAPELVWTVHRGYTHAFLVIALAAPLAGVAGRLLGRGDPRAPRGGDWRQWALLAFCCLLCHTLFDLATSWGTMPLLPFSNARLSWDMLPILDVFMTSTLTASFVANRLLRRERVDDFPNPLAYPVVHEHPGRRRIADWFARAAGVLVVAYIGIALQQNLQTVRVAREELAEAGVEAVEVRALPVMFTYVVWEIAARDADGNVYNAVHSSRNPTPMAFVRHASARGGATERALATRDGALFAWLTQDMFVSSEERAADGSALVRLSDRRSFALSAPRRPRFAMEFAEEYPGGPFRAGKPLRGGFGDGGVREEFCLLWDLTVEKEPWKR